MTEESSVQTSTASAQSNHDALPVHGHWIQIYRGAIRGATPDAKLDALARALDSFKRAGCTGVALHGFTHELTPDVYLERAAMAHARGLGCAAAFGLDSDDPLGKGARIGAVAKLPECAFTLLDLEGKGEDEAPAAEADHARRMLTALRAAAPDAVLIDQPWLDPTVHSAFPLGVFAEYCDARAAQLYCNDLKSVYGAARYARTVARSTAAYARCVASGRTKALPMIPTWEAYGWDDIAADLDACIAAHPDAIWWSEPFPKPQVLAAIARATAAIKTPAVAPV